ncbi:hypothetical protein BurJ1DRAFT_0529 [Burkholderiales bacterium JOSHI_001]|nr:hypothetical protein BurJ1DRAFT_0529 [Burkholderiales bacterium JOSHI_001]
MSVATDLLDQIGAAALRCSLPAVKALHLPPPSADGSRDGEFCAIELDDGSLGLSFVLLDRTLADLRAGAGRVVLPGLPALQLARQYLEGQGSLRTLGFAAVNAITRHLFDRAGFKPPPAAGSVGDLDLQPGDHLGMVGFFPPLIQRVLDAGAQLTVVELRADLVGERDGFRVTLDAAELRHCNKVLSTSTVLLNQTLDAVLAHCAGAQRLAMVGPGAGCLPDALFARGLTLLGGSWIDDPASFKAALAAGDSWGPFATKFALRPDAYPGLSALLARATP